MRFQLWQLMLVWAVVFVVVVLPLLMGNFYFTEGEVLQKIQRQEPTAAGVVDVSRNIIAYSEVIVKLADETERAFFVDSCITFNVKVHPKQTW